MCPRNFDAAVRQQLIRSFSEALANRTDGLGELDECSVAFDDMSMPQPDIVLTIEPDGEGPIPIASVRLIVEVADTTLAQDLGRKQRLYACHGIAEYWVADLAAGRVVRMWGPEGENYAQRGEWALGVRVESATIAGLALYFAFYNFCRIHKTLRVTPAMAAGITDRLWSLEDIVAKIDAMAPAPKARGPYKKREA